MAKVDFTIPVDLVIRITDIDKYEIESYVNGIMMGIEQVFSSDDPEDDHYEVVQCNPQWMKSFQEEKPSHISKIDVD